MPPSVGGGGGGGLQWWISGNPGLGVTELWNPQLGEGHWFITLDEGGGSFDYASLISLLTIWAVPSHY